MPGSNATDSCGLLCLPSELLQQCMPEDGCNIQRVCHKLFNLRANGYNSRSLRLHVSLNGATDGDYERARKTLELMKTSFPSLKKLDVYVHIDAPPDTLLSKLLTPHPIHGPAWLINLVDVTISVPRRQIENFIPQCLADVCPELKRLELSYAHCQQQEQQQPWHPVQLPHLTHLVLDICLISMQPEAVQQQLEALPSLTDFRVHIERGAQYSDRFSGKITDLYWYGLVEGWLRGGLPQLKGPWPKLRKLVMIGYKFGDADMEVVMNGMTSLEQLTVRHFLLSQPSINPLPCLRSVTINGDDLCWQSLQGLYHLVRSCKKHITVCNMIKQDFCLDMSVCGHGSTAEADLAMAASVASVLQQEGLLSFENFTNDARIYIAGQQPPHVQQVLHLLLPIFSNLQFLELVGSIHVSTALLTAMGNLPRLTNFELSDDTMTGAGGWCSFEEGMWDGRMLALIPQVTHLSLTCHLASEACVIRLCCKAPRPIKLWVEPVHWTDGELLLAVLAAAECSMAELQMVEPADTASTEGG